jgi:Ca-activated chloride channel family protein
MNHAEGRAIRMKAFIWARLLSCISFRLCVPLFVLAVLAGGMAQSRVQQPSTLSAGSQTSAALFKESVDLVLVPVSVLDHSDRPVTDLTSKHFIVFEDKVSQTVKYFSHQDTPVALAVVLDASGSMAGRLQDARIAAAQLIATSNPEDEFDVVIVGDTPRIVVDRSDSLDQFQQTLAFVEPGGQTALWDSLMTALGLLRSAPFERKVMVVITDGGDNHSRATKRELKSVLKEAGVQLYTIALYNPYSRRTEERIAPLELDDLTSVTGGRIVAARDRLETQAVVTQISREVRDQYVLGYYPMHPSHDGRWHKIRVSLSDTRDPRQVRVFAKKGYIRPAD